MGTPTDWLGIAQRLQALAQAGLAFDPSGYDRERYEEIRAISFGMLGHLSGEQAAVWAKRFADEQGYPTPKVDVRCLVFGGEDRILMVRETADGGRWTLPGGWADIGYTPFEVAQKELHEETGLRASAKRLVALWDKRQHAHPPQPWYCYKAVVLCEVTGGALRAATEETTEAQFMSTGALPALSLSTDRITLAQLQTLLTFARDPNAAALCD